MRLVLIVNLIGEDLLVGVFVNGILNLHIQYLNVLHTLRCNVLVFFYCAIYFSNLLPRFSFAIYLLTGGWKSWFG